MKTWPPPTDIKLQSFLSLAYILLVIISWQYSSYAFFSFFVSTFHSWHVITAMLNSVPPLGPTTSHQGSDYLRQNLSLFCLWNPLSATSSYLQVDGPRHTGILEPWILTFYQPTFQLPVQGDTPPNIRYNWSDPPPPGQLSLTITSSTSHEQLFFRLFPSIAITA